MASAVVWSVGCAVIGGAVGGYFFGESGMKQGVQLGGALGVKIGAAKSVNQITNQTAKKVLQFVEKAANYLFAAFTIWALWSAANSAVFQHCSINQIPCDLLMYCNAFFGILLGIGGLWVAYRIVSMLWSQQLPTVSTEVVPPPARRELPPPRVQEDALSQLLKKRLRTTSGSSSHVSRGCSFKK